MDLILLVIVCLVLFGGVGRWGYTRYNGNYAAGGGFGLGSVLVVVLVWAVLTHRL